MLRKSSLGFLAVALILVSLINASAEVKMDIVRQAYRRGETISIQFSGLENDLEIIAKQGDREYRIGEIKKGEKSFSFSSWDLSPGDYLIEAKDRKGNVLAKKEVFIIANKAPSLGFATFGIHRGKVGEALERFYEYFSGIGGDMVFVHVNTDTEIIRPRLDSAYKYGIAWSPILNTYLAPKAGDEKLGISPWIHVHQMDREEREKIALETGHGEYTQFFHTGKLALGTWVGGYPYACPNAPFAQKKMIEYVERAVSAGKGHPGFELLALDDEYSMLSNFGWGSVGFGFTGYCQWCEKLLFEKTGLKEMPMPIYKEPGYIEPKDSPFAKWRDIIGVGEFGGGAASLVRHNIRLKEAAHRIDPDLKICQMPGALDGELDKVLFAVYTPFFHMEPVSVALFEIDRAIALSRGTNKPLFPIIGWYDQKEYFPSIKEFLTLKTKMLFSKGIESFGLFPYKGPLLNEDIKEAWEEIGNLKETYGPMFLNLKTTRMPIAVFWSQTVQDYQKILKWEVVEEVMEYFGKHFETPWKQLQVFTSAYPALYYSHLPVEIITEKEILEGKLKDYKALILFNHEYAKEDVVKKIAEFEGKVFADKSSLIKPEGTIIIPADFTKWHYMIRDGKRPWDYDKREEIIALSERTSRELIKALEETVLPHVPKPIEIDNNYLIYTLAENADSRYLFIFNTNLKKEEKGKIKINLPFSYLYDVMEKKEISFSDNNKSTLGITVERGDWKVYLLSPGKIDKIGLEIERRGFKVSCQIKIKDEKNKILRGTHPLLLTIVEPDGDISPYSTHLATDKGRCSYSFRLAKNDPKGKWTVILTELITGKKKVTSFIF